LSASGGRFGRTKTDLGQKRDANGEKKSRGHATELRGQEGET